MDEDKQVYTTYSLSEELRKRAKALIGEVRDTLGLKSKNKKSKPTRESESATVVKATKVSTEQFKNIENISEDKKTNNDESPTINVSENYKNESLETQKPKKKSNIKIKKEKPQKERHKISKEDKEKIVLWVIGLLIIAIFLFAIIYSFKYLRLTPKTSEINIPKSEEVFCGGIAGIQCPNGYYCKLDGNYPDAGGHCVKASVLNNL